MLIHNFLEDSARQFPDKHAVWFKEQWMDYDRINRLANKLAGYLVNAGINKGDRVAILYENSFEYIITYYAILKVGAVSVALNTDTNAESLIYLLNDDPEDKFDPIATSLNLDVNMGDLPGTLQWIDIRTGNVISEQIIEAFPAKIDVPEFNDGIFGHLKQ